MNFETRARAAAEGLRSASAVDAEARLAGLRRTHRRRSATLVAASAAVIAGLIGGVTLALDEPHRAAPPADQGPVVDGIIVDSIGGDDDSGETPPSALAPLNGASTEPYPVWQAFDQDTSRFLFTGNEGPGSLFDSTGTIRVLAPGLATPVATISCKGGECHWPAFGPGPDEVTAMITRSGSPGEWPPRSVQVYGFDGSLREKIDLPESALEGSGIADIAWSPDGTRLAISTFTGSREPDCQGSECVARVWLLDAAGGDPVLLHRQSMPPRADPNPPLLQDLAWAPDGKRLGLISSTYDPETADPPTLTVVDIESGEAETIHEFDDCVTCNPPRYGYAWSPDGTRIAVTSGAGIAQLSSDGTVLVPAAGSEQGPLAWLIKPSE